MSKHTAQAAKIFIAIALLMTLQACANRAEYKTEYAGVQQRWDSDSEAKKNNVRNIELINFNVRAGDLHFSPRTHYILKEYDFERYKEYERWYYGPEWHLFLLPPYGWIVCLTDLRDCFGYTTEWGNWPNHIDKNDHPNGNIQKKTYSKFPDDAIVKFEVSGQLPSGKIYTSSPEKLWRISPVNIKNRVQNWPEKPSTLSVKFNIKYQGESYDTRYDFTDSQIASLALESDSWNSPQENRHKYFYQLTSALQAENHSAALIAYKKLESMDFEKPESFWYRYALSAKSAGRPEVAAAKAQQYLQVSVKRIYEKEARALLSSAK